MLEDAAAKVLPAGYRMDYTGESRQLRQESGKFLPAMGLAIVLIFLVLAAQFNSFRDPFVILAGSVPLAMFGALAFTFLKFAGPPGMHFKLTEGWTTTLNIYSQVGLVTLVGLVSKNGILIVEFANTQQLAGMSKIAAVQAAAATRLRPILMTTVATVVGHFPLTLVTGAGAVARNSIGIVLVGGMSIGTLFTLFVVPSVYVLLAKDHSAERKSAARADSDRSSAAGTAGARRVTAGDTPGGCERSVLAASAASLAQPRSRLWHGSTPASADLRRRTVRLLDRRVRVHQRRLRHDVPSERPVLAGLPERRLQRHVRRRPLHDHVRER